MYFLFKYELIVSFMQEIKWRRVLSIREER